MIVALFVGLVLGITGTTAVQVENTHAIKKEGKIYFEENKLYKCEDIYEEGDKIIRQAR